MTGEGAQDRNERTKASDTQGSERLRRLDAALGEARDRREAELLRAGSGRHAGSTGLAFRLGAEFVAGVAAGAGLGWVFDFAFGTLPWGLIVFLLLGFVAGLVNVVRAADRAKRPRDGAGR